MNEELIVNMLTSLPNFAGFIICILLLYRALSTSQANMRELTDRLMDCYRDSASQGRFLAVSEAAQARKHESGSANP